MLFSIRNRNLLLTCSLAVGMQLAAQDKRPDNTAVNKHDQSTTADKQGMSKSDTELVQKIRKAIVAEKTLSTYGRNVKVIARDGRVTVKGPVRSEEEKSTILAKARGVAGESNITDEITIAPPK